jgi:hypothetical protein
MYGSRPSKSHLLSTKWTMTNGRPGRVYTKLTRIGICKSVSSLTRAELTNRSDPTVAESDRLKKRIAELEQVVRELRQKHVPRQNQPAAATSTATGTASASAPTPLITIDEPDKGQDSKKRRVIVDRFARFKIGEAALADMAAAAHRDSPGAGPPHSSGDGEGKVDYKTETYHMNMNPGEEMIQDKVGRKTFLGAPAGASMLRRVCRLHSTLYRKEGADDRFEN